MIRVTYVCEANENHKNDIRYEKGGFTCGQCGGTLKKLVRVSDSHAEMQNNPEQGKKS